MRIVITALLLTGCTLATDLDDQDCETDLDCGAGRVCSANNFCLLTSEARDCVRADQCEAGELCAAGSCELEETARWSCAGAMSEAPIRSSDKVKLRMKLVMHAAGDLTPLAGTVTGVACAEPDCNEQEGPFVTDRAGIIEVEVDQGFKGLIKLSGENLLDTYYQLQAPLNADLTAAGEVTMLSATDVLEIARAGDGKVNLSEQGVVLFQVLDCLGDLAGDVSVDNLTQDQEVEIVYLAADKSADTAAKATSSAGVAVVLHAPIGTREFGLAQQSSRTELGSLAVTTIAGAVSYVPYQLGR